jgi:glycosyltransferase involved in cell wall biosynthesis
VYGALEIDLDRKEETFLGGRQPSAWEAYKLHSFSPRSYVATTRLLRALRPDLVVVWNLYLASLAPLVACRRSGRPLVVHVCDKWLAAGLTGMPSARAASLRGRVSSSLKRLSQPLLRVATRPRPIVAISHFIKGVYVRAGFPAEDIDVIHLGVPTRDFACVERREAADGALRLLYVGSLWEGKGPQVAVRALARLVRSGVRRAHLDVCGTGTPQFVAWLGQVVAEEGMESHVTFHGFAPADAVRRHCQSHDILVFPSQWDEPFAAVPVEAMSCGMAIAATTASPAANKAASITPQVAQAATCRTLAARSGAGEAGGAGPPHRGATCHQVEDAGDAVDSHTVGQTCDTICGLLRRSR